jgi:hypothetical protein
VIAVVVGALMGLTAFGLFAGGGVLLWADQNRDGGYVTSGRTTYHAAGYAIRTDSISIGRNGVDWGWPAKALDKVRVRVTGVQPTTPVFVGIAPAASADLYLAGVEQTMLNDLGGDNEQALVGGAPKATPAKQPIWSAQTSGTGTQTLVWPVSSGDWTIVVMNADASRTVDVTADIGATVPSLPWIAAGLLIGGGVLLVGAVLLVAVPVRRAGQARAAPTGGAA